MTIHIKNISASHERLETFLNQLVGIGKWNLIKDTYTIKETTQENYDEVVEFQKELAEEGSTVFVKINGL